MSIPVSDFSDNIVFGFEDTVAFYVASYSGKRIHGAVFAQYGARAQHAVTANLGKITHCRAEFLYACLNLFVRRGNGNWGFVAFHVGGDSARSEMRFVTKNRISYIIIVGYLNAVKDYAVFYLSGIAHNTALADESAASDKRTVSYLGICAYYAGGADICRGENLCAFGYPDVFAHQVVFFGAESFSYADNKILDFRQNLPRILIFLQKGRGESMPKIK